MSIAIEAPRKSANSKTLGYWLRRYPLFIFGCIGLAAIILLALFAPLIATHDPVAINPAARLRPPSDAWLFGSDPFGRDVFSRVIWGGRVSLTVGIGVAALSVCLGLAIGMIAAQVAFRWRPSLNAAFFAGLVTFAVTLIVWTTAVGPPRSSNRNATETAEATRGNG